MIPPDHTMPTDDRLLARVRGEYLEMPGLRLTLPQACRLWQLDGTTCLALLEQLVVERCLHRTPDGTFIAFASMRASMRPKPAKAALPVVHPGETYARRRA